MTNELFATKGIEYLLVIGYLLLLVSLRHLIFPRKAAKPVAHDAGFLLPEGLFYHQGHTWAKPEGGHFVRIGMDDLAQMLIGDGSALILPNVGTHVEEGEPAFRVQTHGHAMPMLSPVNGDVVAINTDVLHNPHLFHEDPYERGWLLEVRVPHPETTQRNLLHGELAHVWMDESSERLHDYNVESEWDELAREIFLLETIEDQEELASV